MWREVSPDEQVDVRVDGYRVRAYSFGKGANTVLCLNGGPGLPCDYLREAHSCLIDHGYRVVAFDQLGTGASDRPDDASLWTIGRYVAETETVRRELGLGRQLQRARLHRRRRLHARRHVEAGTEGALGLSLRL